jgi:hypothetical protein
MGAILNFSSHSLPVTDNISRIFVSISSKLSPYFYGINVGGLPGCFYICNSPGEVFCGLAARDKPNGRPLAKPSTFRNTGDRLPNYIAPEKKR